jgi:arginine repressor
MNDQNTKSTGRRMLDNLSEDVKEFLCELSAQGRIIDVVSELKKRNINASAATVCRFLRRERERRMLEEGEEMKDAVNTFANRSGKDTLKKATLEAVRQRLYEQALSISNTPDGMTKVFETLLKEEMRLKELELESRRTAVAEENVKIQRQRLQIDAFKAAFKYIPEALRILGDDSLDDKIKVIEARRCLAQASAPVPIPIEIG